MEEILGHISKKAVRDVIRKSHHTGRFFFFATMITLYLFSEHEAIASHMKIMCNHLNLSSFQRWQKCCAIILMFIEDLTLLVAGAGRVHAGWLTAYMVPY